MSRKLWIGLALLAPVLLWGFPLAAVDPARQAAGHADDQARQREGGRAISREQRAAAEKDGAENNGAEKEATEEGLPSAGPDAAVTEPDAADARGRFRPGPRWRLGVFAYNTPTGVVVARVVDQSPAERAGFEPGDRIVAVSGYQVGYVGDEVYYLGEELQRRASRRGDVLLLVQNVRDHRLLNLPVRLETRR